MIALFRGFVASVTFSVQEDAGGGWRRIGCFAWAGQKRQEPEGATLLLSPVLFGRLSSAFLLLGGPWASHNIPNISSLSERWQLFLSSQPWLGGWEAGWHWRALGHSIPLCALPCLALKSAGTRENCEPEVLRFRVQWVFQSPLCWECSVVSNFLDDSPGSVQDIKQILPILLFIYG